MVVASARKQGDSIVLYDSKGQAIGRIANTRTEEGKGRKGGGGGKAPMAIVQDKEGMELVHCYEKAGWFGGTVLSWDTADGGKVATAKGSPKKMEGATGGVWEWEFEIFVDGVHPCVFLFGAAYRMNELRQQNVNTPSGGSGLRGFFSRFTG